MEVRAKYPIWPLLKVVTSYTSKFSSTNLVALKSDCKWRMSFKDSKWMVSLKSGDTDHCVKWIHFIFTFISRPTQLRKLKIDHFPDCLHNLWQKKFLADVTIRLEGV